MAEIGAMRDEWMRRTGPFYPLVVAFQLQSLLPAARTLQPSAEDLSRARPWLAAVGVLAGVGVALLAALLRGTGLAPVVVGALAVAVGLAATGGRFELGLARTGERLAGTALAGAAAALPIALTVAAFLFVRAACLWGTDVAAWTGAIVASHIAGRLAMLVALEGPELRGAVRAPPGDGDDATPRPRWVAFAVAGTLALVVAGVAGKGAGIVALLFAAVIGLVATRLGRTDDAAAGAGALAELLALLCFAAAMPAPWP